MDDIKKYINEKGLNVDAEKFYNYFTEGNWIDSKGQPVKNWKQKLLTWNEYSQNTKSEKNINERNYKNDELNQFYSN